MIITIEPGIYFRKDLYNNEIINNDTLDKYFDIGGIRIEDTVVILDNGCKILNNISKEIKTIENLLN